MTLSTNIKEAIGVPLTLDCSTIMKSHSHRLWFLVTGGCGYLGFHLAKSLHALGIYVRIMDVRLPSHIEKHLDDRLKFIKGDVRSYSSVCDALCDVIYVFHVASFGLSGADQLLAKHIKDVNVGGTQNIIRACQEKGVEQLVYTSSYNVVLGWKSIENGDESVPYADPNLMVDYYSITKLKADQLVLEANGSSISGGGVLKTCCLRPSAIYGPKETRHIDRMAFFIEKGIVIMKPGDAINDWVHVNNLVQAHLLTVLALSSSCDNIAAGKAYFISDDKPMKMFTFLTPLFHALGRAVPRWTCPFYVIYCVAFLLEWIYYLIGSVCKFPLFMTRGEVNKLTVDHYHNMDKARRELGYQPKSYDFADVVASFMRDRSQTPDDSSSGTFLRSWGPVMWFFLIVAFLIFY